MAKVSIIVPSYNHNSFLKDRLDSIINQTFKDWELIIIDDDSNDGSKETLQEFVKNNKSKVSRFIINKKNSGSGYQSWYTGINLVKSEYIWIAETDDYSDVTFLEEMIKTLDENKNVALAFCTSIYVDANKNYLYTSEKRTKDLEVNSNNKVFSGEVYVNKMPFNTYITNGSAVVFRKPKKEIPKELFKFKQCSDIFLWTYLLNNSSFVFLNKKLNYFRRHEDSTSEKISIHKKKSVYFEKAVFLNYYNQQHKYKGFINHYLKFYIDFNRKNIFDIEPVLAIEGIKFLKLKYLFLVLNFFLNKFKTKNK
ncbi:MAG: glycosyltransferase [Polaribacter sp.]|uniref:glycosyltransferase family 2 protein n=1 Tax=Polaribacter sp. TaxID=1920175 RepID=UPI003265CF04